MREQQVSKRRKGDGFAPGNTGPDGNYVVGKNKPPVGTQFKPGDARRRGRREKGTRNLATDLREELESKVDVSVGGVRSSVTRQRAIIMRLAENASRGETRAIALLVQYQQNLIEPMLAEELQRSQQDDEMDYSLLSVDELLLMEQMLLKAGAKAVKD
jgi:hypothetical protein